MAQATRPQSDRRSCTRSAPQTPLRAHFAHGLRRADVESVACGERVSRRTPSTAAGSRQIVEERRIGFPDATGVADLDSWNTQADERETHRHPVIVIRLDQGRADAAPTG